jgi:hypothetical protein
MNDFDTIVTIWRRADERARLAEQKVVLAYEDFVAGRGTLPRLELECDAALKRREASEILEVLFAAAKRIRRTPIARLRRAAPRAIAASLPKPWAEELLRRIGRAPVQRGIKTPEPASR